jgi:hypothetical protein
VETGRRLIVKRYIRAQVALQALVRRSCLTFAAITWALLALSGLSAQSAKPTDFQVKAAYLYNFGRFVEWPANLAATRSDAFTVCVLGQDPFGPALDATLAGQMITGKRVIAKRISAPQDSGNCQVLFLSLTTNEHLDRIIAAVDKNAVLTVSDMPQFLERGGMIQFVLEGNRVRFEVNLTATRQAGLTLSSELLKVAIAVKRDPLHGD